jgi:hypothetical protein
MRIEALVAVTCLLAPLSASAGTVDTYAELTRKTVLAPSTLPALPDSIDSEQPATETNMIVFLEKEFSKKGISVVQDGPCFVRLVPGGEWQGKLSAMPLRGAQLHASSTRQLIPAGAVNFSGAELTQVLEIYAELKGRTILRSQTLPSPTIRLKNQSPLTREEMVYALETVLAMNGLGTVDDGQAFVQIVPIQLRSQVNTHAPTAEEGAKLFDAKKVPSIGYSNPRPQTKMERDLERWQKAFFEFIRLNGTRKSSAQDLLELYAQLTDKKAEPSRNYETSPIWFHVATALSKSELLYAIETTFALSNIEIMRVGEDKVRLAQKGGSETPKPQPSVGPVPPNPGTVIVTAAEVDPASVRLTAEESRQPNLSFVYLTKRPEEIRACQRWHPPVLIKVGSNIVARAPGCTGMKGVGGVDWVGLVVIFDDLEQARAAKRALKGARTQKD